MKIDIDKIKCFQIGSVRKTELNMSEAKNRTFRDLLVAVIIAFERVNEPAPQFVLFDDCFKPIKVIVFTSDVTEDDVDNKYYRITLAQKDLDEQAEANCLEDEEPWVKFKIL